MMMIMTTMTSKKIDNEGDGMIRKTLFAATAGGFLATLSVLAVLYWVGAVDLGGGNPGGGDGPGIHHGWLERAHADVGRGEYQFLPCRRQMWVVNRTNGKIVYYKFFETEDGKVERSDVSAIDLNVFPTRDTQFMLSDRNFTSLLWVANIATGDFQMWRANGDSTLTTGRVAVPAGDHLLEDPSSPGHNFGDRAFQGRRPLRIGSGSQAPAPRVPSPARPPVTTPSRTGQ